MSRIRPDVNDILDVAFDISAKLEDEDFRRILTAEGYATGVALVVGRAGEQPSQAYEASFGGRTGPRALVLTPDRNRPYGYAITRIGR